MTVESATYVSQLNGANPTGSDAKSEGDDHIRLLKNTIVTTFPGMAGVVTATHTQLNKLASTFSIASAPSNAMYINASGYVGLGRSPGVALDVLASTSSLAKLENGSGLGVSLSMLDTAFAGGIGMNSGDLFLYSGGASNEGARVDRDGNFIPKAQVTPPALTVNSQMVFNLTSNTNLRVSVRGSDGVTRTANLTLS